MAIVLCPDVGSAHCELCVVQDFLLPGTIYSDYVSLIGINSHYSPVVAASRIVSQDCAMWRRKESQPVGGRKNREKKINNWAMCSNKGQQQRNNKTYNPPSHSGVAPSDDWTPTIAGKGVSAIKKNRIKSLCVCVYSARSRAWANDYMNNSSY